MQPFDIALALNFSYQVFKHRSTMLRYFRGVRESLSADGIFVLDLFGGPDSLLEEFSREPREVLQTEDGKVRCFVMCRCSDRALADCAVRVGAGALQSSDG